MDNLQQLLWGEWVLCSSIAFLRFPLFWTSLEERAGGSLRRPPRGFNPVLCWRIKAKCQQSTHCIIAAVFPESIFCVALGPCTLVNTGGRWGTMKQGWRLPGRLCWDLTSDLGLPGSELGCACPGWSDVLMHSHFFRFVPFFEVVLALSLVFF